MPKELERMRGGVVRYRTVKPTEDTYIRVAITRKKGPHGGRTIAGKLHYDKQKMG